MSSLKSSDSQLTRRHWMVLTASALSGCGGGGTATASLPGTGGTGIYVQGSISGLGSVIINGIKFDDVAASAAQQITVDGVLASSADMRLGMVAGVQGERDAVNASLGVATRIEVWSIAQGLVNTANGTDFTVSGMTIKTNAATLFDSISGVAALTPGISRVIVWGLQAGANGSNWIATRIKLVSGTVTVSTGVVSVAAGRRHLNGLLLAGTLADDLAANQLVRVQGTLSGDKTTLTVSSAKLLGPDAGPLPQGEVEIEGLVTTTPDANQRFMLGNIEVDASAASLRPTTLQIALGNRVEVYGLWQAGVLKATKIERQSDQTLNQFEIEGLVQQYTSLANFVVRSQRCDASALSSNPVVVDGLKLGVKVSLKGTKDGDMLRVLQLEFEH